MDKVVQIIPAFTEEVIESDTDSGRKMKILFNSISDDISNTNVDNIKELQILRNIVSTSYNETMAIMKRCGIRISTITLLCKLVTKTNLKLLAKYIKLDEDNIVSIEYGDRKCLRTNRCIYPMKKKTKKTFLNQATIRMKAPNIDNTLEIKRNCINIKIFKNGSLQITGPKDMEEFYYVIKKVSDILEKGCTRKTKDGKKKIRYIPKNTSISIQDPNIRLINTDFKLNYKVDRKKLGDILKLNHNYRTKDNIIGYVDCDYASIDGHSGVHIIHHYNETNVTHIFVFHTGSIIMTGAKNIYQILDAYQYIMKIISHYKKQIQIVDIDPNKLKEAIIDFRKPRSKLKSARK